jgi:hypothetical protein
MATKPDYSSSATKVLDDQGEPVTEEGVAKSKGQSDGQSSEHKERILRSVLKRKLPLRRNLSAPSEEAASEKHPLMKESSESQEETTDEKPT